MMLSQLPRPVDWKPVVRACFSAGRKVPQGREWAVRFLAYYEAEREPQIFGDGYIAAREALGMERYESLAEAGFQPCCPLFLGALSLLEKR